ncbi:hypothetical protein IDSA_04310 [Pseudidiomarina salinarum]|uniref:Heme oxygenase n=1 Tax=Pseudidiomarina salinarum TaxID=435908 RepID=A0A094J1J5_9GAMM|nr:biliverdin-producing heme oxygenase [Pseudidiomarina salinarum]KFZ31909.1 hypothetical protein IDSA_04310 [Pseudidiomarina salinarum]RUO70317.1 hypothetical protein CWI79_02275 [Pseudidiomarina salinarum]
MDDAAILQQLRTHTADLHREVESGSVMSRLLQPDLTANQYLAALQVLAAFITRYETQLIQAFDRPHGYQYIPRLPLLMADIEAVGNAPSEVSEPAEKPPSPTRWGLIGAAYVIEGSTQGGRILGRRIEKTLGPELSLTSEHGISYFNLHQRGSWIEFTDWLSQLEHTPAQRKEIVGGAQSAFRYLSEMLTTTPFYEVH